MTNKVLAIGAAATLAISAIGTVAVVNHEVDQCRGAFNMAYESVEEFQEASEELQYLGNQVKENPFSAIFLAGQLGEARRNMDEANEQAGDDIEMARGVCSAVYPTEKFAHAIVPDKFDTSWLSAEYREVLNQHNAWAADFRAAVTRNFQF